MKRVILTTILICIALSVCMEAFAKNAAIRVYVNDRKTKLNSPVVMRNGKVYIGLRDAAKALKADTRWNAKTKTAIVTSGNKRTKIPQSDGVMINNILYLPLRLTGEALGCTIEWVGEDRAVKIFTEAPCPIGGG